MPKFFNTSRGPVSFVTASGQVAAVGPKKWLELPSGEASSNSLIQLLQRGILVRAIDESVVTPVPAPVAESAQEAKKLDAPAPVSSSSPPVFKTRAQRRAEAAAKQQATSDDKTSQDQ